MAVPGSNPMMHDNATSDGNLDHGRRFRTSDVVYVSRTAVELAVAPERAHLRRYVSFGAVVRAR